MIAKHFIIMKKLIPIIVVFFFFSCRKEIIVVDKNYEGNWLGTPDTSVNITSNKYVDLKIDSQSNLSYQFYSSRGGERGLNFGGKAKVKNNNIHVSGILFGHSFTIISPPTQINASNYHWTMTLDGPDGIMPYYK